MLLLCVVRACIFLARRPACGSHACLCPAPTRTLSCSVALALLGDPLVRAAVCVWGHGFDGCCTQAGVLLLCGSACMRWSTVLPMLPTLLFHLSSPKNEKRSCSLMSRRRAWTPSPAATCGTSWVSSAGVAAAAAAGRVEMEPQRTFQFKQQQAAHLPTPHAALPPAIATSTRRGCQGGAGGCADHSQHGGGRHPGRPDCHHGPRQVRPAAEGWCGMARVLQEAAGQLW